MYIVGLVKEEICSYKKKSNLGFQVKNGPFYTHSPGKNRRNN